MLVEAYTSFKDFAYSWKDNRVQAVPEIASCIQESNQTPDVYSFVVRNGRLYSSSANCYVRDVICTNTGVGGLEGIAFDFIEEWFRDNKEGVAVWISPLDKVYYPNDSKIIISEILQEGSNKRLRNRAIILDYDAEQCLEFARALSDRSINRPLLESVSAVRVTPLILATENWLNILRELIVDEKLWEKIESGQDLIKQEEVLEQAGAVYEGWFGNKGNSFVVASGYFGDGSLSCPTRMDGISAFGVFLSHSAGPEGCSKIRCGKCGWEPNETELKSVQSGEIRSCPRKKPNGKRCGWQPT